jgi:hypothetical protein
LKDNTIKTNQMKQLIIDRSKWRTGGRKYDASHGKTLLLNNQGNMCCLGFYCLQLGELTENEIKYKGDFTTFDPDQLSLTNENIRNVAFLYDEDGGDDDTKRITNTLFSDEAIEINDNQKIDNYTREQKLIEHFKTIDVDVTFINEYNYETANH